MSFTIEVHNCIECPRRRIVHDYELWFGQRIPKHYLVCNHPAVSGCYTYGELRQGQPTVNVSGPKEKLKIPEWCPMEEK